jgi:hypothetical protein
MHHINRNFAWCNEYSNESFTGILHEEQTWDDKEYFKLEESLFDIAKKYSGCDSIPREDAWKIFRIFSYLIVTLACHSDPNDGFNIVNLTDEQVLARRERIQLIFEGFFSNKMPSKEYLEY